MNNMLDRRLTFCARPRHPEQLHGVDVFVQSFPVQSRLAPNLDSPIASHESAFEMLVKRVSLFSLISSQFYHGLADLSR
jgi:hypothetical protein